MPLSEKTIATVEKTAPAIAAAGPTLIRHFYIRMFSNNPELKDIFNMAHQRELAQPKALFDAIVGYATHLRDLSAIHPLVERIAYKHTSFNIKPDQYKIVGSNLLKTIEEELNPGQEVLDAWAEAYAQLADVFIQREEEIYKEVESREGGWRPTRAFKVAAKNKESDLITSFRLVPADGKPTVAHRPGEYIAIFARHPTMQFQEIRQYSITSEPNNTHYDIALRRHDQGQVSQYMHDRINVGDELHIAPPYGDFFLEIPQDPATPIVLLSGGVGQTPVLSMLRTLVRDDTRERPVFWLHSAHNHAVHAFANVVADAKEQLPKLQSRVWLSEVTPEDRQGVDYDFQGHMDLSRTPEIFDSPAAQYYFVGPDGFMKNIEAQLRAKGVPQSHIHYECFGPFNPAATA